MLRKVVVIFPLLRNSLIIAIAVAGLLAMQIVPIIWLKTEIHSAPALTLLKTRSETERHMISR